MENHPPANARVVARGRLLTLPLWLYLAAIGGAVLYFGGLSASLAIAILFLAFAAIGIASVLRSRVWVSGSTLYVRQVFGYKPPIRLDELHGAELIEVRPSFGRALYLTAADGSRVRLDATNLRLKPLYAELARHIPAGSLNANRLLHRRMEAARSIVPPPDPATESSLTG